jgi:hypothetical protein
MALGVLPSPAEKRTPGVEVAPVGVTNLLWIAFFAGLEILAADRPRLTKLSCVALIATGLVIASGPWFEL